MSGEAVDIAPGKGCTVKSITEEHPTGRSMIYHIVANCGAAGQPGESRVTLNFGPSESEMQLQVEDKRPVRLARCR
jgi:hypothetical protein